MGEMLTIVHHSLVNAQQTIQSTERWVGTFPLSSDSELNKQSAQEEVGKCMYTLM